MANFFLFFSGSGERAGWPFAVIGDDLFIYELGVAQMTGLHSHPAASAAYILHIGQFIPADVADVNLRSTAE